MKMRKLSIGEKQAILKLRKEGKSIRAIGQTLGIANTTIWNVQKKKTTGVLSNRYRTGWPRKTTTVDVRNIVRAVRKKTQNNRDITNNPCSTEVKVSQFTIRRSL